MHLLTTKIEHEDGNGEDDPHFPDVGTGGVLGVDRDDDRHEQQPGHHSLPSCFVEVHLYQIQLINYSYFTDIFNQT